MFTELRSRTRLLTVPAAFALSLALTACAKDETIVEEAEEQPGIQLVDGQEVTIEGEVEQASGPNAFTIGADETLVFGAEAFDVDSDDEVVVTGTVEVFVIEDIEEEFGIDFDDDFFVDYDTELAVRADSVEIVEEG